jgi:DNA-binding transcriptional LysR family regulator
VRIYELSGVEIERRLLAGQLDIGIGFLPPRQPALHGVELYPDELQLVIPADHPLREFKKVSLAQAAELPMLLLGEEFRARQIWQEQLAAIGRRPRVQAELNHMSGILDSLPHSRFATVLPGRARQLHSNRDLLWKPLSEPRIPLSVGLVYRDAQRQHSTVELLRSLLEGVVQSFS